MVNPRFFFEGKLSREEATSAFMATLLEQSVIFRGRILQLAGLQGDDGDGATIEIERDDIDVSLTLPSCRCTVIIENKIYGGSKEHGQLQRYYRTSKTRRPDYRIVCVYVAPTTAIAESEVSSLALDAGDSKAVITWDEIASATADLDDFDQVFAVKGCEIILNLIADRKTGYFDATGDRARLYELIRKSHALAVPRTDVMAGRPWQGRTGVQLDTRGTALTVHSGVSFDADKTTGHFELPRRDNHLVVTLSSRFRAARKYAQTADTRQWWEAICSAGEWILNENKFSLDSSGWMKLSTSFTGSDDAIAERIADDFIELVGALKPYLQAATTD